MQARKGVRISRLDRSFFIVSPTVIFTSEARVELGNTIAEELPELLSKCAVAYCRELRSTLGRISGERAR